MGRILALDVGTKRIGVSVSDILHIFAQSLTVIQVEKGKVFEQIKEIISDKEITKIIIGMPYRDDNTPSKMGEYIIEFTDKLKKVIDTPIQFWDERYSSNSAEEVLIKADMSRKKRKKVIDKVASSIILQSYLDKQSKQTTL